MTPAGRGGESLARLYAFHFLTDNDAESKRRVDEEMSSAGERLEALFRAARDPARRRQAGEALEAVRQYLAAFDEVAETVAKRNDAVANILDLIGPDMARQAVELQRSVFESLSGQGEVVKGDVSSTERVIFLFTSLAAVAGLLISAMVARGTVGPIRQTNAMLKDIAEGEGDLTRRVAVESRDEIGEMGENFNRFVGKLQGIIGEIAAATNQVATAAEELSAVTEQTASGVRQQSVETEQVATAMNEMSATVREVARNAEAASGAARGANDEAAAGNRVVKETVAAIEELASEVQRSTEVIERLKDDSQNIGTVLDVIKSIAEQTNLLALNAAIEAARAGEQGRGFAVVADEVRTLAQRTQKSTGEIEQLIETLQGGAGQAVGVMQRSRERANLAVEKARHAGDSLDAIAGSVNAITDMNTQIAGAAEEQSSTSEEINRNINNIQAIAERTAAGSDQTAAASQELSRLGEQLRALVNQFKV